MALTEFPLFSSFPPEIRNLIYRFALLDPPTGIELRSTYRSPPRAGHYRLIKPCLTIPSLLHTCRESRHEGLRSHKPMFKSYPDDGKFSYIAWEATSLRLEVTLLEVLHQPELCGIQCMYLEVFAIRGLMQLGAKGNRVLQSMPKLKELHIVFWQRAQRSSHLQHWPSHSAQAFGDRHWKMKLLRLVQAVMSDEFAVEMPARGLRSRPTIYITDRCTNTKFARLNGNGSVDRFRLEVIANS